MTFSRLPFIVAIAVLIVTCQSLVTVAVPLQGIVTDNLGNTHDNVANVTHIVVGDRLFDINEGTIAPVVDASLTNNSGIFIGRNNPAAIPGSANLVFTDLDVASGKANSVDGNFIFSTVLDNSNGALPDIVITDLGFASQTDGYTVTAIIGGTAAAPVFGGSSFNFAQNTQMVDTGQNLRVRRNASEDLTQDMIAGGIDLSDLGVTSLIGVRVETSGGDPSLVLGLTGTGAEVKPLAAIFEDNFDLDPDANGWTESLSNTGNPGDIFPDGNGQVVLGSDGLNVDGNDFDTRSITRTIDATGFFDLRLEIEASEDDTLEGDDIFSILVDDGNGFVAIVTENDDFTSLNETTFLGSLENSVFDLRIQGTSNVEDFFLDRVAITGRELVVIPEPATALLGLIGLAGLARRRRHAA